MSDYDDQEYDEDQEGVDEPEIGQEEGGGEEEGNEQEQEEEEVNVMYPAELWLSLHGKVSAWIMWTKGVKSAASLKPKAKPKFKTYFLLLLDSGVSLPPSLYEWFN